MITNKTKRVVITHLERLAKDLQTPINLDLGICNELFSVFSIKQYKLYGYFRSWPNFSGNTIYPVPYVRFFWLRGDPRGIYRETTNMWVGKYGDLRRDLCMHIANKMKKELER